MFRVLVIFVIWARSEAAEVSLQLDDGNAIQLIGVQDEMLERAPSHVEWSHDLNRWHSLQNISFEESPITVIDESPTSGKRFYRIRIEE